MTDQKNQNEMSDFKLNNLLQTYRDKLNNKNLSQKEHIILAEFFIKDQILRRDISNNQTLKFSEDDMLKYAFLGYWIYNGLGH